ncbi:MAG TPA: bifunctional adenosylcobinamide kinase/adenosylcobinamide-phosphate guanylyltransferase [Thiomicrorhabdus sp.]|nr:bifunctional adenosylcobinamide kinase/adenosylcobinamide-phosphate guanylyltransferase [Thiomicrorhabdus sp.]
MIQFILGGARSGKSAFAEKIAKELDTQGVKVFYIATAQSPISLCAEEERGGTVDSEMQSRIQRHQADRPSHWKTIECSIKLADCLQALDGEAHCVLVDCLTLWTLNILESGCLEKEKKALLLLLPELKARVILVSNEVGLGVVPMGKLTRCFVDELGWLHQEIARYSDEVVFVTAGLPRKLK